MSTAETLFDVGAQVERTAELSPCGRYRYSLTRRWDASLPAVLFVMLNPSTADAAQDDPTIRRCIGFARRWGAGGIHVCNLYPWRATKPADLPRGVEAFGALPVGHPHNERAIRDAVARTGRVIVAWGASLGPWPSQPNVILALLHECGTNPEALGLTKDGQPRHPLYVRGDAEPVPYVAALGEKQQAVDSDDASRQDPNTT